MQNKETIRKLILSGSTPALRTELKKNSLMERHLKAQYLRQGATIRAYFCLTSVIASLRMIYA